MKERMGAVDPQPGGDPKSKPRVEWVQRQSMGLANLVTASSAERNSTLRERGTELMQDRFGPLVPSP